jgi:hypothetical protein
MCAPGGRGRKGTGAARGRVSGPRSGGAAQRALPRAAIGWPVPAGGHAAGPDHSSGRAAAARAVQHAPRTARRAAPRRAAPRCCTRRAPRRCGRTGSKLRSRRPSWPLCTLRTQSPPAAARKEPLQSKARSFMAEAWPCSRLRSSASLRTRPSDARPPHMGSGRPRRAPRPRSRPRSSASMASRPEPIDRGSVCGGTQCIKCRARTGEREGPGNAGILIAAGRARGRPGRCPAKSLPGSSRPIARAGAPTSCSPWARATGTSTAGAPTRCWA